MVRRARQAGLAAIALTDHDTTAGVHEAVAEGDRLGVRVVQLRQRLPRVEAEVLAAAAEPTVVAVLGPTSALDGGDAAALAGLSSAGLDLLIAQGVGQGLLLSLECLDVPVGPPLAKAENHKKRNNLRRERSPRDRGVEIRQDGCDDGGHDTDHDPLAAA